MGLRVNGGNAGVYRDELVGMGVGVMPRRFLCKGL